MLFQQLYSDRSPLWPKIRSQHIKKQPCCQACGSCKKLEVHHIVPYHVDPSQELNPNNLITLCDKYCHFIFGHLMDWKSWNTNVEQDAKEYLIKIKSKPEVVSVQSYNNFSIFRLLRIAIYYVFKKK